MTLGDIIRIARKERNWTQEEVARRLNASPSAVSQMESNTIKPGVPMLMALSKLYGISTDELLAGVEDRAEPADGEEQAGEVGAAIQRRRKALGMSQSELGELTNSEKSTVSRWESGETVLNADRLREVAAALRTTVGGLLGEETIAAPSGAEEVDTVLLAAWRRMNRKARRKLVQIAVIIAEE